ncbi:ABC transporter substrate-binding protein [Pandoraea sp. ISTKB]|uniref:ABC transporter substrate-binding protein n=1 Tax=Pandoraea sp. ISTKB TaxID=1586708 RepID=UPI000846EE8C|nr:ABC transporter substrate-binding protein [Pandoraea sp. ISTKB]ODP34728.1 branched-chain amino acid ABC transporter substrate-binding protein [Pandoraea sp. ISTKB]
MKFPALSRAAITLGCSAFLLGLHAPGAFAEIKVGVSLSTTGPAASIGIPEKNTMALLPRRIGNEAVTYIVLDDASDPAQAVANVRKFVSEDHVDAIFGSTTVPSSLAMSAVAAESHTPMISLAAGTAIVEPVDDKRRWIFKTPQNDALMADAVTESMASRKVKTVAFIGFSDAYGEGWYTSFSKSAQARGIKIVANERYARTDTSVTGQVLRMLAGHPDAVLIAGAGTPAVLPQKTLKERGYQGVIYQTHGVTNNDFLRLCGADCEGTLLPAGPLLVVDDLPQTNPVYASAQRYKQVYEKAYGAGTVSPFGANGWDAGLLLQNAVKGALKVAKPGTEAFRSALRDGLENVHDVAGSQGIFNMSPTDHAGLDARARVMVKIEHAQWRLAEPAGR